MDFDLRDWLLILGPVFISCVLLHGYWRMRRGANELKMSLDVFDRPILIQPHDPAETADIT